MTILYIVEIESEKEIKCGRGKTVVMERMWMENDLQGWCPLYEVPVDYK